MDSGHQTLKSFALVLAKKVNKGVVMDKQLDKDREDKKGHLSGALVGAEDLFQVSKCTIMHFLWCEIMIELNDMIFRTGGSEPAADLSHGLVHGGEGDHHQHVLHRHHLHHNPRSVQDVLLKRNEKLNIKTEM